MKTIILPGFSLKNKDWLDNIYGRLIEVVPSKAIEWAHWRTGKAETRWIEKEAKEISLTIQGPINIIAKSIGTAVATTVLKLKPDYINKIILCGVPINDFIKGDEKYYKSLKTFPQEKFICFQNEADNHGGYKEVERFLHSLNHNLLIVSKPRSDHEYPYPNDFIDFLTE